MKKYNKILPIHLEVEMYESLRLEAYNRHCSMSDLVRSELDKAEWNNGKLEGALNEDRVRA